MPQTLELTDGTTTVNFLGSSVYLTNAGWAPAVARRRRSELGNRSDYENVVEEITVNVTGALTALRQINELLDQAHRWYLGDPSASPVRLRYRPDNSTLGGIVLEAPVYGALDDSPVELPNTFNDLLQVSEVNQVTIRLVRGPLWLNPTAETATSNTVSTLATVMSCTFTANHHTLSPVDISLIAPTATSIGNETEIGISLIFAPSASAFTIITGAAMTGGATTSTSGSLRTGTPTAANTWYSHSSSNSISITSGYVLIMADANNGPVTMRASLKRTVSTSFGASSTNAINLNTTTVVQNKARVYNLGYFSSKFSLNNILIEYQAASTSYQLEITNVIIVSASFGAIQIIQIEDVISAGNSDTSTIYGLAKITTQPLTTNTPYLSQATNASHFGTDINVVSYGGSIFIQSKGQSLHCVVSYARKLASFSEFTFASRTMQMQAKRYLGYLIPE